MHPTNRRSFLKSVSGATLAAAGASAVAASLGSACSRPPEEAAETAQPADPTAWFRQAKFGLFIHWGPYSVAGVEASWPIMVPQLVKLFGPQKPISEADYTALPKKFNPTEYDPAAWVRLAKQAGMRYLVITSKHHDGFCMFDAPGTDYKITNAPYGKDALAPLAAACHEQNMPLGFYYSPPDMHHPGYRDTSKPVVENWMGEPSRPEWAQYLDYMESHLRTLLTNYGEVAIIWFDGLFGQQKYNPERFHKLIHELSPRTIVNDRLGEDLGDYVTPEQFYPEGIPVKRQGPPPEVSPEMFGQFLAALQSGTGEKLMAEFAAQQKARFPTEPKPAPEDFQLWETCLTMNNTWGYNPTDTNFKSAQVLIRTLAEVASRGGNLLLNVGPSPQGTFPAESVERLRAIGEWMAVNGDAIYGATYGPLQGMPWGRTTAKDGVIYLHVFDWPAGKLEVPGFAGKASDVSLLAAGQSLSFQQSGEQLTIDVPAQAPDANVTVIAIRA